MTINQWDAKYVVIQTTVTVDFDYRLVSKDGTELWKANKRMQYTPQNQRGGLIGQRSPQRWSAPGRTTCR